MPPGDEQQYSEESEKQEPSIQLISATLKKAGLKWLPIFRKDTESGEIMFQGVSGDDGSPAPQGKDGALE